MSLTPSVDTIILEVRAIKNDSSELVLRSDKDSPLTSAEMDGNLITLENLIPIYLSTPLILDENYQSEIYLDIDQSISEIVITDVRRDFTTQPLTFDLRWLYIDDYEIQVVDSIKKLFVRFIYTD